MRVEGLGFRVQGLDKYRGLINIYRAYINIYFRWSAVGQVVGVVAALL